MKTVVIVAPQFSPCSYPPAIRVRFFTNHLEKFAWKPIVLSVDPEYMEEPQDPEFAGMLSSSLEVIRTRALPPKWTRRIGLGDLGIRAFPFMLPRLRSLCRERKIDALLIPGPPWHTFLLGPKIKREFNIPYIMDYIDPWISSMGEHGPLWSKAYWYRKSALWLEPHAVRDTDHITSVYQHLEEAVGNRYPFLDPGLHTSIPYGTEPDDFAHLRKHKRANNFWDPGDGLFHIAYVGAMLPKAYDVLRAIFSAVKKLQSSSPVHFEKLRFHFIGTTYAPSGGAGLVTPLAREAEIESVVQEHPQRIPYLDAINALCQANATLILGTSEKQYAPSKLFPNLLAQRPIFSVLHAESIALEILAKFQAGLTVTFSDQNPPRSRIDRISEALVELLETEPPQVNDLAQQAAFAEYTAEAMTARLANVLNNVSNR